MKILIEGDLEAKELRELLLRILEFKWFAFDDVVNFTFEVDK